MCVCVYFRYSLLLILFIDNDNFPTLYNAFRRISGTSIVLKGAEKGWNVFKLRVSLPTSPQLKYQMK